MATAILFYPFRKRWKRASDDDNEKGSHSDRQSTTHTSNAKKSPNISIVEQDYLSRASEAWESLWRLLHKEDWKLETGHDAIQGCVKSRNEKNIGKIFMLQGIVPMNAEELWKELVFGVNESPSWNPTLLQSKTLQELDDETCITYNISAEAVGGIVSSRDFVTVRRWGKREDYYLSAGMSTKHPDMPVQKNYVRGENGAGGWAMRPSQDDAINSTELFWVTRTDLKRIPMLDLESSPYFCAVDRDQWNVARTTTLVEIAAPAHAGGWLPQAVVDKAMSGFLLDFLKYLRKHVDNLQMGDHV